MSKAIDRLQKQYETRQAETEKLRVRVRELMTKREALAGEMDEVASAGDLVKFRELKAKLAEVDEELYVVQQQRKKPETVAESSAASAWKECRSDYEKEFDRLQKALQKTGDDMERLFMELVRLQSDALRDRERLAVYAGIDPDEIEKTYTMRYITPNRNRTPGMVPLSTAEVSYFLISGRWKQDANKNFKCEKAEAVWAVIGNHKPANL